MKNLKIIAIVVAVLIAIGIMCFCIPQFTQNNAIALEEQITEWDSGINVQEKRRVDLVYNLADCVKQYDKHESDTLMGIADKRSDGGDINDASLAIAAVAESYPELKSDKNYRQLMTELSITENTIAEYRLEYNKNVKEYNRYIRKFPNKQLLNLTGYESVDYTYLDYEVSSDAPQDLFE